MEEQSNMVLDWYYQYFIESTKTIDYGINTVAGSEDATYVTLERVDLTPMPIDLMVEYEDGTKELFYLPLRIMRGQKPNDQYTDVQRTVKEDWPWVYPSYTLKIDKPVSEITRLEIDPSHRLADINRKNNVFDVQEKMTEFSTEK
jgi:hypothetical protein